MGKFQELNVWQKSKDLAVYIYNEQQKINSQKTTVCETKFAEPLYPSRAT
jgi:hypothetical protein